MSVRVSPDDIDLIDRHAEFFRGDLRHVEQPAHTDAAGIDLSRPLRRIDRGGGIRKTVAVAEPETNDGKAPSTSLMRRKWRITAGIQFVLL